MAKVIVRESEIEGTKIPARVSKVLINEYTVGATDFHGD